MSSLQIIDQKNPTFFAEAFQKAIARHESVLLVNSTWQTSERTQIKSLLGQDQRPELLTKKSHILIPTGGTSGQLKLAIHTPETLSASAQAFQRFFALERVNCFCILPLYHVSGLMQWWRSHLSGGDFKFGDYQALKRGILPDWDVSNFCLSLVPTQLQVLLQICPQWLAQFRLILLGGAPPWRSLLEQARQLQLRIALTYGMTETASQVVALKPADFLAGKDCAGQVLPHANLSLSKTGLISIAAQSLFLGYYPKFDHPKILKTDDVGHFDQAGYLHLLGRQSQKIISGGENIYPAEIEAAILGTKFVKDAAVLGLPDPYWGEVVIAVLSLKNPSDLDRVKMAIAKQLSPYKQPKHWLLVEQLPRNAQGKLNRIKLRQMIENRYQ
ncbi:2-succinylbenzoate--CoA ligase [Picosynechococcus sp. PCC 7117]|uniref:2-succinylbenzoate--CoA ligase n=1 Tax=Picosynechococcus sp. PCC 7117 TaxID=195498 RepID=UPI00081090D2|nr:2-succinylbenzoate--CoA ligase [Picosynechococcus sp. PCC 7117]ANV87124.1 2-succinylbenzoate-CoA ligase [Picosynechococcus sp. PCC 7117]